MSSTNKKILLLALWGVVLLIGPYTVLKNTPVSTLTGNKVVILNFFQRMAGLLAFTLVFFQIMIGSNMHKLTEKIGSWVFNFHIAEGAFAYFVVLSHPVLFVIINYQIKGNFDPFYVFSDLCILCSNRLEFFYTLGRMAFWFITLAVIAAKLRTQPWLRLHWRKFHVLNYFAFFLIWFHARQVGTDFKTPPFSEFSWLAIILVILTIAWRLWRKSNLVFPKARVNPTSSKLLTK